MMENSIMKITRLQISKLHGCIDYDVVFNKDLTFLYGDNGCGKTTILNIITFIITGKVYRLFDYRFESINLFFENESKITSNITITHDYEDINVTMLGNSYYLYKKEYDETMTYSNDYDEFEENYFRGKEFCEIIRDTFNYVYLPLNRDSMNEQNSGRVKRSHRIMLRSSMYRNSAIAGNLLNVLALTKRANNIMTFKLNQINERFIDSILKSFLDFENISSSDDIINYMNSLSISDIDEMQRKYLSILTKVINMDKKTSQKIIEFFGTLRDYKQSNKKDLVEILLKFSEISKINNIISMAEQAEEERMNAVKPIDTFVETVNSFIGAEEGKKSIHLDEEGELYLKTPNGEDIGIQYLSSGEKQILTFFAHLIFSFDNNSQSIFIVDEPELSLHLNWQRKFVDSVRKIKPEMQLIFATHAPEIIGKHTENAVKLIPMNTAGEKSET